MITFFFGTGKKKLCRAVSLSLFPAYVLSHVLSIIFGFTSSSVEQVQIFVSMHVDVLMFPVHVLMFRNTTP